MKSKFYNLNYCLLAIACFLGWHSIFIYCSDTNPYGVVRKLMQIFSFSIPFLAWSLGVLIGLNLDIMEEESANGFRHQIAKLIGNLMNRGMGVVLSLSLNAGILCIIGLNHHIHLQYKDSQFTKKIKYDIIESGSGNLKKSHTIPSEHVECVYVDHLKGERPVIRIKDIYNLQSVDVEISPLDAWRGYLLCEVFSPSDFVDINDHIDQIEVRFDYEENGQIKPHHCKILPESNMNSFQLPECIDKEELLMEIGSQLSHSENDKNDVRTCSFSILGANNIICHAEYLPMEKMLNVLLSRCDQYNCEPTVHELKYMRGLIHSVISTGSVQDRWNLENYIKDVSVENINIVVDEIINMMNTEYGNGIKLDSNEKNNLLDVLELVINRVDDIDQKNIERLAGYVLRFTAIEYGNTVVSHASCLAVKLMGYTENVILIEAGSQQLFNLLKHMPHENAFRHQLLNTFFELEENRIATSFGVMFSSTVESHDLFRKIVFGLGCKASNEVRSQVMELLDKRGRCFVDAEKIESIKNEVLTLNWWLEELEKEEKGNRDEVPEELVPAEENNEESETMEENNNE